MPLEGWLRLLVQVARKTEVRQWLGKAEEKRGNQCMTWKLNHIRDCWFSGRITLFKWQLTSHLPVKLWCPIPEGVIPKFVLASFILLLTVNSVNSLKERKSLQSILETKNQEKGFFSKRYLFLLETL
jgi:hypothetical protein